MAIPAGGADFAETPGYRMGLLLLLLLAFVLVWDFAIGWAKRSLGRRRRWGLRAVVKALEKEITTLGLVSLLLAVIQEYLVQICIDCDGPCEAEQDATAGSGRRRSLLQLAAGHGGGDGGGAIPSGGSGTGWAAVLFGAAQRHMGVHGRALAVGSGLGEDKHGRALAEGSGLEEVNLGCGPGSEPFWSPLAVYQLHIFLFLLGATHVVYAGVCLLLTSWRVKRWRRWEALAPEGEDDQDTAATSDEGQQDEGQQQQQQPKQPGRAATSALTRPGSSWAKHYTRSCLLQFSWKLDGDTYLALRRMFIDRFGLPSSFDFMSFVLESLEEQYSIVAQMDVLLFPLAVFWLSMPRYSYLFLWFGPLALAISLVLGAKLRSVSLQLADAAHHWARPGVREAPPTSHDVPWDRQERLQQWQRDIATSFAGVVDGNEDGDGDASGPLQQHQQRRNPSTLNQRQMQQGGFSLSRLSAPAVLQHQRVRVLQAGSKAASASGKQQQPSARAIPGRVQVDAAAAADAIAGAADVAAGAAAAGGADAAATSAADAAAAAPSPALHQAISVRATGSEISGGDMAEGDEEPVGGDNRVVALLSCIWHALCGGLSSVGDCIVARPQPPEQLAKYFAGHATDSTHLFWFGRPRLILRCYQLVFFATAQCIATLLFSIWQDLDFSIGGLGGWALWAPWLVMAVLVMVHGSLLILPLYALCSSAGTHCPSSLLEYALEHDIKPHMARELQRLSIISAGGARVSRFGAGAPEPVAEAPEEEHMANVSSSGDDGSSSRNGDDAQQQQQHQHLRITVAARSSEDIMGIERRSVSSLLSAMYTITMQRMGGGGGGNGGTRDKSPLRQANGEKRTEVKDEDQPNALNPIEGSPQPLNVNKGISSSGNGSLLQPSQPPQPSRLPLPQQGGDMTKAGGGSADAAVHVAKVSGKQA